MFGFEPLQRRILVVDDDRAILELVCTKLTLAGYDAVTARNGQDALAIMAALKPSAMVLDLNMPVLDGFSVLQEMGRAGAEKIPTLVLTARHAAADVQRAMGLGARDYLAKPFRNQQLLMRVARLYRQPLDRETLEDAIAKLEASF